MWSIHLVAIAALQLQGPVWLSAIPWPTLRLASLSFTVSGVCSNSCSLSWWFYPTTSSSIVPFSSCLQSFPASQSLPKSLLFIPSGQSMGLQLRHQFFQWIFSFDFLQDWLVWSPCWPRESQEPSPAPQFESINSWASSLLDGLNLTSIHDCWKNHNFDYVDLGRPDAMIRFLNTEF